MINPKDIAGKKFDKGGMFGYKTEEVDEYLKDLSYEYAQLMKEKTDIERKLEILAEKVREYRNDEDALKEALLGAQRQGKEVIAEAKRTADRILAEANVKADEIVGSTRLQVEKEKSMLKRMQKEVSDFKAKLLSLYKSHLDLITALPEVEDKQPAFLQPQPPAANDKSREELTFTESSAAEAPAPSASSNEQQEQSAPIPLGEETKLSGNTDEADSRKPLFSFGGETKESRRTSDDKFGEMRFGNNNR